MPDEPTDQPDLVVYSDYLCPFCYLGKESLETYLDEAGLSPEIEWRPFDLQGHKRGPDRQLDHSVDDGKTDEYFERAKRNVQRLADQYDVEMQVAIHDDLDSWNAQKLAVAVQRDYDPETFRALHEALFTALWQEGRDIGNPDVLADIAADHGLDAAEVREIIDDESLDDALAEQFDRAHRTGVRAVPTFVYGERATQGAIPPERFAALLED